MLPIQTPYTWNVVSRLSNCQTAMSDTQLKGAGDRPWTGHCQQQRRCFHLPSTSARPEAHTPR